MKKFTFILFLFCFSNLTFAQPDVPFDKALFKDRKEEFKIAEDNIAAGDAYYFTLYPDYISAVPYYLKANTFNPNSADLNYKIGICYLNFDKYKMKTYFERAYQIKPTVTPDILYYIGWCYQLESNWTKAIEYYNMFAGKATTPELAPLKTDAFKKIQECKNGELLAKTPDRVWIDNVGKAVNTEYPDYAPIISTDEALMIFTTRRPGTEDMSPQGGYWEDLYISKRVDGEWSMATPIGKPVNVKGQHDATIGLSPDGHTLYVYNDDRGNGDIYESTDEDGAWTQPELMEKTINTDAHEPDASLTFDGKRLYFTSDKPGGLGGHDIYYSDWDSEKEKWGEAVNVGNVLNTPYSERSVFIHPRWSNNVFCIKRTQHNGRF